MPRRKYVFWFIVAAFTSFFIYFVSQIPQLAISYVRFSQLHPGLFAAISAEMWLTGIGLVFTAIGTLATILFAWRADRRAGKELEMKIRELEKKLSK